MSMLGTTIRGLGARHSGNGVTDEDCATGGAALIWTLCQGPGERFSPEV